MKLEIFSVYDSKAGAFIVPFFLPNVAMAVRSIRDAGIDREHMFGRHPEDYTLYHVGTFDDHSSEFTQVLPIKVVGIVSQIVEEYAVSSQEPKDY